MFRLKKNVLSVIDSTIQAGAVQVNMDRALLLKLLEICVYDVQFLFNGTYYNQIDGVAMGSPLGPILANIFVGHIEKQIFNTNNEGIIMYGRYVDDVLVCATSIDCIERLSNRLNAMHPNIKFTVELENQGSIPFLDVRIIKKQHGLSMGWYHKDTWSGAFLHYLSYAPRAWKEGLLKGFKYRVMKICSQDTINDAISELTSIFENNGYPEHFIKKHFIDYVPINKKKVIQAPRKPVTVTLPYLGEERTHNWAGRIKRYVESVYPTSRVIFFWATTRAYHLSLKDKLPKEDIPGVVYHFSCVCCETYVGRTDCCLKQRIKQHIPAWLEKGDRTRPRSNKPPDSAITRHLMQCAHAPTNAKECFKILHKGKTHKLTRILEALEIMNKSPSLCVQKDRLFTLKIPWR